MENWLINSNDVVIVIMVVGKSGFERSNQTLGLAIPLEITAGIPDPLVEMAWDPGSPIDNRLEIHFGFHHLLLVTQFSTWKRWIGLESGKRTLRHD